MSEDPHKALASEIFNVEPSEVTPMQRRSAKAVRYMLHYNIPGQKTFAQVLSEHYDRNR